MPPLWMMLRPLAVLIFAIALARSAAIESESFGRLYSRGDPTTHDWPNQKPAPRVLKNFAEVPSCQNEDIHTPSDSCVEEIQKSGNNLFADRRCFDELTPAQHDILETSFADAKTIAEYINDYFDDKDYPPGELEQVMRYYMGKASLENDEYRRLILRNLGRLRGFLYDNPPHSTKIFVHCDDPKKKCENKPEGPRAPLGGYAWTDEHWFWWWSYHINMCNPFYEMRDLEEAQKLVESPVDGRQKAGDLQWLQTTASMIIHEVMHTYYMSNSPPDPPILDINVNVDRDDVAITRAYGPKRVYQLAHSKQETKRDGIKSRLNSDSYVQVVNALYWWRKTHIFPGVPGKPQKTDDTVTVDEDLNDQVPLPETLWLGDQGGATESTDELWDAAAKGHPRLTPGIPTGD